ncbi:MAG: hypothetical protein ISS66_01000 [Desulfobacteraceae bacterium]|nr:hypothetical protein [Desulfobacteraceae bacterium]
MIIGSYEQAIEDTVPGCMVPCDEQRNVAIFLMRRLRGEKLEEIGRQFGIAKYSSVSSAIERMKREISVDRRLKARVKSIEKILENSQQQI